jgi:peptidoglycan/xylan/chitin deacetylase (PgdA/CDA1 family)
MALLWGSAASGARAAPPREPNELGRIPIIEYHSIGDKARPGKPRYDSLGLNIAPETLRRHLELMYASGWYPVNMRDALTAHIRVPRGKIPVVLTFDDARTSQFRYRKDGTLDPDCALGILEAFHAAHPDWPRRATFYILPESQWNGVPFGQDGLETKKLNYLVRQGYELANHGTSHHSMVHMDARQLRWELANCCRYVQARAPQATMDTLATPYGFMPRNRALWSCLLDGEDGGTHYHNLCILLAQGGPAYPPLHRLYDARRITRILPLKGSVERWTRELAPGQPMTPFISDGDPNTVTIPKAMEKDLNRSRLGGARLVVK